MKKYLLKSITFIAIVFMASACNHYNGISVTKRHYSKGNYVSVSKNIKPFVYHAPSKNVISSVIGKKEITSNAISPSMEEKGLEASSSINVNANQFKNTNRLEALINNDYINKTNQEPNRKVIKNLSQLKKGNSIFDVKKAHDDDEARSLFWLVITILLIIWLIGLLSGGWGLGGLINLLLLIALILFILWLLRII